MHKIPPNDNESYLISLGWSGSNDTSPPKIFYNKTTSEIWKYPAGVDTWLVGYKKMPLNTWHHFSISRNVENNIHAVYLNGSLISSWEDSRYYLNVFSFGYCDNYNAYDDFHFFDILYCRVSKGIRYNKDFVGQTPIDDLFYNLKENNDNVYGKIG